MKWNREECFAYNEMDCEAKDCGECHCYHEEIERFYEETEPSITDSLKVIEEYVRHKQIKILNQVRSEILEKMIFDDSEENANLWLALDIIDANVNKLEEN